MAASLAAIRLLGTINRALGIASVFLASCFVGLMTLVVCVGVFWRYVLNNSLPWVEDISLILMVTMAFVVAPFAYRTGQNVAITILVDALPQTLLRGIRIMINLLVLWIVYRYFLESLGLVERGWGIRINSVALPWAYPYFVLPVVLIELAMVALELIARDCWCMVTRSDDAALPESGTGKGTV